MARRSRHTIRLPGGHRITGVPDIRPGRGFTPTAEEMFWSVVLPPNPYKAFFGDPSGEEAFYFGLKFSMASIGAAATMGESLTALNMMRTASFVTSPPVVVGTAMVASAIGSFFGYRALVESQPVEEQPRMWWHWIAALSGTGPGIGGYTGHIE